jgi:hypothetical protein
MRSSRSSRALRAVVAASVVALGVGATIPASNAEPPAGFAIGDASVVEGDTGTHRNVTLTVTLDADQAGIVTVAYTTAIGSADLSDYKFRTGTLKFNPGVTTRYLSVRVFPDASVEGDEFFFVILSNPTGGMVLDDDIALVTIIDDDSPDIAGVSLGDAMVWNGDSNVKPNVGKIAVTLDVPATGEIVVEVASAPGSASVGTDYKNVTGLYGSPKKVKFQTGQFTKYLPFTFYTDGVDEIDEDFTIYIVSVTGPSVAGRSTGTITILDDDV